MSSRTIATIIFGIGCVIALLIVTENVARQSGADWRDIWIVGFFFAVAYVVRRFGPK